MRTDKYRYFPLNIGCKYYLWQIRLENITDPFFIDAKLLLA